jgi:hypothetical protein
MEKEKKELVPKRQSLFPLSAEDIVDGALENLDERQARRVTEKAADEVIRLAVEKRKAEYRMNAAQDEMRNLIHNADLLDRSVDEYRITSTFQTATGTTNVEIQKSRTNSAIPRAVVAAAAGIILLAVIVALYFLLT